MMASELDKKAVQARPAGETGFTLVELLIAILVLGILAAIAVPSYQDYVRQANRAEAKGILLENAQLLERNYTTANRYDTINQDGTGGAPPIVTQSPKSGTAKYNIAAGYGAAPAQTYSLSATPVVGGAMDGDVCGTLTLDQTGQQGAADVDGDGTTVNDPEDNATCWQR